jgi:hypothetical protein
MSIVEIHHSEGSDALTTRLRAVLRDHEVASLDIRWGDRRSGPGARRTGRVEIGRLEIDPAARERGILGRLFDRLAALGRERGIRHVDVVVHHAAIDACTAIGFRATDEAFWEGVRRYVPMSLDLTTWSSIRGRPDVAMAITRLCGLGAVLAPLAGVSGPPDELTASV